MKTFVDMLNQESCKELLLRLLPGLSSAVQLEIHVKIAQTLLPILHKIEPLTNNEVQEHISISFISIVIHRPSAKHEPETNGNQLSYKMLIDVARLSSLLFSLSFSLDPTRTDDQRVVRRRWTFLCDPTRLDPEEIHRLGAT
jgi:hypothetical protein